MHLALNRLGTATRPAEGSPMCRFGTSRKLFGCTSCTAADFGYAADCGDGSLPLGMTPGAPPPTPMRR